jgi:hypothetical protein
MPSFLPRAGLRPFRLASVLMSCGVTALLSACAPQAAPPAPTPAAQAVAPVIEPKALAILEASCRTLAGAQSMSFTALNTYERAARNGQPLFYSTRNLVTMQRPDKLRVITPGDGIPDEFYYDGKTITAFVPVHGVAARADAPPTLDEMLDFAWHRAAIYFPFADVISADPCVDLKKQMTSAFVVGQSKVIGDTTTDMIAVAGPEVAAELWIGANDHLPRLIRVIYPKEPARALYQTEYSNWRLNPVISLGAFTSARAATAKPMPFVPPGPATGRPTPATAPIPR